jgi:hypothetical protein
LAAGAGDEVAVVVQYPKKIAKNAPTTKALAMAVRRANGVISSPYAA